MQEGLSQDQVALVLRRAAELDRSFSVGAGPTHLLDEAAVEQAAIEAGMSQVAVRRALAELKAGVLRPEPVSHRGRRPRADSTNRPRGLLGPAILTLERAVPGPLSTVERQLHAFLQDELFELRRDQGIRTTWIRRRGLEATARRAIDRAVQRRLILREVNHLDLTVVDHDETLVLVRLDVDVVGIRHTQGTISGSATAVGGGVAAGTGALAGLHPAFFVAAATGAGVMGAGHWLGRSVYGRRVGEIETGIAGVLDRLERGHRAGAR